MDQHNDGTERIVEELRMLLDAAASRAQGYLNGLNAEESATHSETSCGWCPICAATSFVRGEHPELAARLGEQVTGLVTLLRQLVEEHAATPADAKHQRQEGPEVSHIDVRRVSGSVLAGEHEC